MLFAPPLFHAHIYIFYCCFFTFAWIKTAKSLLMLRVITALQCFRLACMCACLSPCDDPPAKRARSAMLWYVYYFIYLFVVVTLLHFGFFIHYLFD